MAEESVVGAALSAAQEAGIPATLLVACAVAESGLDPEARRPADPSDDERFWPDVSFGAWQQTVRWAPEYRGGSAYPGRGEIERVGALYRDVAHAAGVAARNLAGRYRPEEAEAELRALCRYNWPAGDGEPVSSAVAAAYRRGLTEARERVERGVSSGEGRAGSGEERVVSGAGLPLATPGSSLGPRYSPGAAVDRQPDDWSCSIQSAQWLLRSLGRQPARWWLEQQLVPSVVSREAGLLDATGRMLAAWVRREYGYLAESADGVSFAEIRALAGRQPLMVGGRRWGPGGHWSGVRGVTRDGSLSLANPAPGWQGIGQVLTVVDWEPLGPWSLVTVPVQAGVWSGEAGMGSGEGVMEVPSLQPLPLTPAGETAPRKAVLAHVAAVLRQVVAELERVS
ncbi:MAG: hypothetical protein IT305_29530 [Chloroflexi bacterium]|nr:hypothetical protein [Chloroflexota bacterium]